MTPHEKELHSGFAEVNGTRLYYEIAGTGTPVVFIHGFSLDTRMWDDQFAAFAQEYQALRYDLRGFGQSALPTAETYGHEADLKALLDHLGMQQPVHLVALSLGGMVAVDFALTYPKMVRTLTLVDALFAGFPFTAEDSRADKVWEAARQNGIPAGKQIWLAHPYFKPLHEQPQLKARLETIVNDYSGWHFVNHNPAVSPAPPAAQRLKELQVPTLIMIGERDVTDFQKMAAVMEQQIAGAHKVVLPGVGHMSNMENPAGFNETVLRFLSQS